MEGIEALLYERFKVVFGEYCEISTEVVCVIECTLSLEIMGVGGASTKT